MNNNNSKKIIFIKFQKEKLSYIQQEYIVIEQNRTKKRAHKTKKLVYAIFASSSASFCFVFKISLSVYLRNKKKN
jgi:hypothetical protein